MSWKADTRPGHILKITKMVNDQGQELGLGEDNTVWGIVLDDELMMVYSKLAQRGYPGAKGDNWVSRVYPIDWADEDSENVEAEAVPDDVPEDFWPLSARVALEG